MRNLIIFSFAVILGLLTSCKDDTMQDCPTFADRTESSSLLKRLERFNDSIIDAKAQIVDYSLSDQTRASSKWKRFIAIAGADALGAYQGAEMGMKIGAIFGPKGAFAGGVIGGVLCGASASYVAESSMSKAPTRAATMLPLKSVIQSLVYLKENTSIKEINYYPKNIHLNIPQDKMALQVIGARHNLILDFLRTGRRSNTDPKKVLSLEEIKVIENQNYINAYPTIVSNSSQSLSFEGEGTGGQVLSLYFKAIQNGTSSFEEFESISNFYLEELCHSSELNSNQIDNLISAISVMTSSVEFWNESDSE